MSIVRSATRVLVCTGATAAGIALHGCSLEAPEVPSFQTQLRIPISEERYTLAELLEDVDSVVMDTADIWIELDGDIDPVSIDDELSVTVDGTSFAAEIGSFDLPAGLGTNVSFGFDELAPPGTPTGQTIVPPFAFAPPERDASGIDSFTSVTFASGELVVMITNNMPIPLAGACGPLTIVARDAGSGQEIFNQVVMNEIAAGATVELREDLTGATMGNTLRLQFSGCSPGSGGSQVDVSDTDHVAIDVDFDGVTAASAVAEVPAQTFGTSGSTSFDDDMPLVGAGISSGGTTVTLQNSTALDATVELRFPGFETAGGETLGFDLPLLAGAQGETTLDFTDVTFGSVDPVTEIGYTATVSTPGSGSAHVAVSSTDAISIDVGEIMLEFAWIEGVPDGIERGFGPFTEAVEWPEETDGFRPAVASITVEISSEIAGAATGQIVVQGTNGGESDTVSVNAVVDPGALGAPVTTTIVIDETNSRLLDVLALYPTEIEVTGTFSIGDGVATVHVDRGAEISGAYDVVAPFAFTVEGGEIELDPIEIELDEDMRDVLRDNVNGVAMETTLSNGFPFGASVVLSFATDSTLVYTTPEVLLDALSAESARVDPVSGKTVEATLSDNALRLEEDEIETLAEPNVYVGVDVEFEPSEGVIVLSPGDEVVVTTVLTVDVTVDSDLVEGNDDGGDGND